MSEFVAAAKEKILLYWMVGIYVLLFTFNGLATATITAMYGMRWSTMDAQDKTIVMVMVFLNWSNLMLAFFNKAIARVSRGEFPITESDRPQPEPTTPPEK